MNVNFKAAQAAAQAEPCPQHQSQAVNVHDLFLEMSACGYTHSLTLSDTEAKGIASRLRGISAVSALLIAGGDEDSLELGDWMRSGLLEALHALADDAGSFLSRSNTRAQKGQRNVY